ncbi:hypothetical protein D3C75_1104060 [compost metagenome]
MRLSQWGGPGQCRAKQPAGDIGTAFVDIVHQGLTLNSRGGGGTHLRIAKDTYSGVQIQGIGARHRHFMDAFCRNQWQL